LAYDLGSGSNSTLLVTESRGDAASPETYQCLIQIPKENPWTFLPRNAGEVHPANITSKVPGQRQSFEYNKRRVIKFEAR